MPSYLAPERISQNERQRPKHSHTTGYNRCNRRRGRSRGRRLKRVTVVQCHLPSVCTQVCSSDSVNDVSSVNDEPISKGLAGRWQAVEIDLVDEKLMFTTMASRCFSGTFVIGVLVFVLVDCAVAQVSVRPTKLWKFLNENEEAVLQRFRESIDEFSVGRVKCLRWVIEMWILARGFALRWGMGIVH